jgi:hypothetical protein
VAYTVSSQRGVWATLYSLESDKGTLGKVSLTRLLNADELDRAKAVKVFMNVIGS